MSLAFVLVLGLLVVGVSAFWVLTILPRSLPSVTAAESFAPSVGTKVYDDNDELITEFHVERRIFVPLSQIPKAHRDAVIATEDARFYSHHGVDPRGSRAPSTRTSGAGASWRAAAPSPSSWPRCSS